MTDPILYCSGLNPETGGYAIPPSTPSELADLSRRTTIEKQEAEDLDAWRKTGSRSIHGGGDPRDLAQAGWGVIFAQNEPPERLAAIQEALKPLLDLRS